jgi:predicted ATPase
MLKQFRVDNFKSLLNVTFEPSGLNLLVGSNNAGKTNLCLAMRFLALTSAAPLRDLAGQTIELWNLANAYLAKPTIDFAVRCTLALEGRPLDFDYELSLAYSRKEAATKTLEVASETLRLTGDGFQDTTLLENKAGAVKLLHEPAFLRESPRETVHVETTAPTDQTLLSRLYDLKTNPRANLFKRYLGSWQYFNFATPLLRGTKARAMDLFLYSDGSNLASVLYSLKSSQERLYRRILESAKAVEPKLDLINFHAPDPEHVYLFFEDKAGKRFGVEGLSDGTLRYLAICTAVSSYRQAVAEGLPAPVLMIEEPENGIYVGHLKPLFEKLEPSGREGQYIFTSHSPYFIDLFDACLEGVWVVRNQGTHSLLTRPDRARLEANLGKFSLGEMHFRGLLE